MRRLLGKWSAIKRYLRSAAKFAQDLFPMLLLAYLLLLLVETVLGPSISYYLNLNYLLMIVIMVGVMVVFVGPTEAAQAKERIVTKRGIIIAICAAVVGAAIVWYKTMQVGWPSYVISVVSGVLIALLSTLIWAGAAKEEDGGQSSQGS